MNQAILSLGSNSSDKESQMKNCMLFLANNYKILGQSTLYSSPALNGKDPEYLNAVISIDTDANLQSLNATFKDYEKTSGRTKQSKALGSIPIDIDIVIWNGSIIREKDYNQDYFQIGWEQIPSQIKQKADRKPLNYRQTF